MMRIVAVALLVGLISACGGGDEPASKAAPAAPTGAASTAAAPAEAAPAEEAGGTLPPAVLEEDVKYDPIDVSKLENKWWDQYSAGG